MSTRFEGRIAAVTGTTSGIGRGIALALEAEGARVFGLDLAPGVANTGVEGSVGEHVDCDVTDAASVAAAAATVLKSSGGRIHHFVANAGSIVAVASMSGNRVVNVPQRTVHYNTAKAGVTALVRSLATEWGSRGVRVNTVSPGYVSTPFLEGDTGLHEQGLAGTVPGRFATVQEIAAGTLYLLPDDAGYCHGTDLLIDGGYSLR